MITITPKDALRSELLTPGWYICEVTNHYTKPSDGDGSTNHFYEIEVAEGVAGIKGVPMQLVVSEKAISMHKNFFIACGAPASLWDKAKAGESQSFDEKNPVGKRIKVSVKQEAYLGRMLNKPADFLSESNTVSV